MIQAEAYLASFTSSIEKHFSVVVPDNPFIGAMLNNCVERAQAKGIGPRLNIFLSGELPVNPVCLTIILGNTIDNSIEALGKLDCGDEKWMEITLRQSDAFLFYEIQNPYNPKQERSHEKKHGEYGLKNVRDTAHRLGGQFRTSISDEIFRVTVMIPLLSNQKN